MKVDQTYSILVYGITLGHAKELMRQNIWYGWNWEDYNKSLKECIGLDCWHYFFKWFEELPLPVYEKIHKHIHKGTKV
jgi:hypothetical protein